MLPPGRASETMNPCSLLPFGQRIEQRFNKLVERSLPLIGAHRDLAHCKYLERFSSRADAHGVNTAVVARLVKGHGFPERAILHGCTANGRTASPFRFRDGRHSPCLSRPDSLPALRSLPVCSEPYPLCVC